MARFSGQVEAYATCESLQASRKSRTLTWCYVYGWHRLENSMNYSAVVSLSGPEQNLSPELKSHQSSAEEMLPVSDAVVVADQHAGRHHARRGRLLAQSQAGFVG